ncbi:hypothetical protein JCM6882_008055 [Rhodosporidiobolus microsporus]
MLASLAGGASCGPSNPLQQLSKQYGQDRGVAQDQFGAAGPSGASNAFRHPQTSSAGPLPNDPSAQQFFQQQQPGPSSSSQPFDLSPLNRALTPSASPAPPPPAWAVAFQQQQQPQGGSAPSAQEQEVFARAFGARPAEQHQWRGEFQAHHPSQQQQPQHAPPPAQQQQQHVAPAARLYGQGFGGARAMMPMGQVGGPMAFQQQGPGVEGGKVEGEALQGRQDWENAFLAQEAASTSSSTTVAAETTTSPYSNLTETRPLTPPLRAHSPIADPAARDALAQTAANLLSTVQSAEDQRMRASTSAAAEQVNVGDKFANSSFMSLMRQLRDGEVAVEGDKVVSQNQPFSSASALDKGKARADGWASDFAATTLREEEGRANASASSATTVGSPPPVFHPGDGVEEFARAQHAWAGRQAHSAQIVRELQEGYKSLEGMWDDEDRARAARERERGKGKGKERAPLQFQGDGGSMVDSEGEGEGDFEKADTHVPLAQASWEEDFDDPAFISGGHAPGLVARQGPASGEGMNAQQREWDMLQQDWDQFEVTATGLKAKEQQQPAAATATASTSSTAHGYAFAQNNPYVARHHPTTTHHHSHHEQHGAHSVSAALLDRHDSILQHEANVQQDPHNAGAWLALGLKQQQNEREELAIAALRRAVELDASVANGGAHLALAVSFTNEGRRFEAYEEIDRWISTLSSPSAEGDKTYANEMDQYRNLFGAALPKTVRERHEYLSGALIRLAQSRAERGGVEGVDADVQIALGVLFNTSEEYEKAGDCFGAALSVRPDDPLLFNRLGATYANSGKTDTAVQYYLAALDLDPGYVRARYNLAVASMNLGQYEEAVQHLVTSLSIQEADAEQDHLDQAPSANATGGITSNTLWDSLNVATLQMHRSDLSTLAIQRDLKGLMRAMAVMA